MPPRKKKEHEVVERIEKELLEHTCKLREEFDKAESDLRERFQLDSASDKIQGLQGIKNAKLGILRNLFHAEVDIILKEFWDEVRTAVAMQDREERIRGTSERRGNAASTGPRTRQRRVIDSEINRRDAVQDTQQHVSKSISANIGKRTRTGNNTNHARNHSSRAVAASATRPSAAPVSLFTAGWAADFVTGFAAGIAAAPATSSAAGPSIDTGPSTGPATGPSNSSFADSAGPLLGKNSRVTKRSEPVVSGSVIRSASHSAVGLASGSTSSSVERPVVKKSKGTKTTEDVAVQGLENIDAQPEQTETLIQIGSRKIRVKGPTRPTSTTSQDSRGLGDRRKEQEAVLVGVNEGPAVNSNAEHGTGSVVIQGSVNEEDGAGTRKKRKSRAAKSTSHSNSSEVIEVEPSIENNVNSLVQKRKKKSKKKESKPASYAVTEMEPSEVNKTNGGAIPDGKSKKSKRAQENECTSADVAEVAPNVVLKENNDEATAEAKDKDSKKRTKRATKTISTAAAEIQPNEVLDEINENPATDARNKKSRTTTKTVNKSTCLQVDEIQQNQQAENEEEPVTDDKTIDRENEAKEAASVVKPLRAGRKKKTLTPEEPDAAETEQRNLEQTVRRSTRTRKPTQKLLVNESGKRGGRRK